MLRIGLAALTVGFLLSVFPVVAQSEPDPDGEQPIESGLIERTSQRLVQLDVSFVPRKKSAARQVPELSAEDFELLIGGKRIEIEYADRICSIARREVETVTEQTSQATAETAPPRFARPATYIFFIEHMLLTMQGQNTALEMIEQLIGQLIVNGNRGMIVSSGARIVQSELTEDADALLETLTAVKKDTGQWSEFAYAQAELTRYDEIKQAEFHSAESARALARTYQLEEMLRTTNRLRRLSATIGGMAEIDAPKAVFYFADIMRKNPGEHYLELYDKVALSETFAFDKVTADASAQGVRLYTIQAQGLQVGRESRDLRLRDAENTMDSLALETGGEMFLGGTESSTMNKIVRRIDEDLGCFYLLGFYPAELQEDRTLAILLRVREDTDAGRAALEAFDARVRGQILIQSQRSRETSLLLAAHAASAAVDSDPGLSTVIPLAYEGGTYQALVQFGARTPDLPIELTRDCQWDLGMTHISGPEVLGKVSGRIEASEPSVPVVLEAVWKFRPGPAEIVSVGREHKLGQLVTAHLDIDWPDPDKGKATVSPIAVVQPAGAIFLRKEDGSGEMARKQGSLGVGESAVRLDRPAYLISLVCRGKRAKEDLWVQRRLVGSSAADFEPIAWSFDGQRCIQLRDLVHGGQLGQGGFEYEVNVYDNAEMEGKPLATGSRNITASAGAEPTEPEGQAPAQSS